MMKLQRKWDILLIHHSHTDIGYTQRQDKIKLYHGDFIRQAIHILDEMHQGRKDYQGFVWQCENMWQVKAFESVASAEELASFKRYVQSREIGLSGSYLNMTELADEQVLADHFAEGQALAHRMGGNAVSCMTADINGFAWGYADAMADNGMKHLFTCIHTHHGMFPLNRKLVPFWWEGPRGGKVLVWNGEYYHFGNELYFSPRAGTSYLIFDEHRDAYPARRLAYETQQAGEEHEFQMLTDRLGRHLASLEAEGYPFDFVPFMVSGCLTDNAPPNGLIAKRAAQLNAAFPENVNVRMVTLDQFFEEVENRCGQLPTYRGDWNDWWADGVGSTPAALKLYRSAQRRYDLCQKLDPKRSLGDPQRLEDAAENMMLFAEHTWGYSSSVSEPWETLVGELEQTKCAYATNANTQASAQLDDILRAKGEDSIRADRPHCYRVINPHDCTMETTVLLYIEFFENFDGIQYNLDLPIEVVDQASGQVLPSQPHAIQRAFEVEVQLTLKPWEERTLLIRRKAGFTHNTVVSFAQVGADTVQDILVKGSRSLPPWMVETDAYRFCFEEGRGLTSVIDLADGKDLVRSDAQAAPFAGVYEMTPMHNDPLEVRRKMGRNRKTMETRRFFATVQSIKVKEDGPLFTLMEICYHLEGTAFYSVSLKMYKHLPRFDAMVRLHKTSVWEPENLYVALPFTVGEEETKYIDKTGCVIRPGIDQLTGTNMEFYLLQNGVAMDAGGKQLMIAVKDTPLAVFGDLRAHPIRLCSGQDVDYNRGELYAWVMNNFWETNFKVDLGGFYEFAYTISTHRGLTPSEGLAVCQAQNEGIPAFYYNK